MSDLEHDGAPQGVPISGWLQGNRFGIRVYAGMSLAQHDIRVAYTNVISCNDHFRVHAHGNAQAFCGLPLVQGITHPHLFRAAMQSLQTRES
jgi:hypothetical protein